MRYDRRLRRLVLVFGVALLATFGVLYEDGFGLLAGQFFSRVPAAVRLEGSEFVALHPVEVLLFQTEISTLVAALAVVPLLAYYAWPTLAERELVRARRRTILVWTGALGATFVAATLVGYLYVAPALLSYRIDRVAWLVVYTTVGFGALACVPTGMWLLNRVGTVSYRGYRENWRKVAISVLVLSSLLSPGVLSMLLAATSTMLAYTVGLLGLWLLTLGGRFDVRSDRCRSRVPIPRASVAGTDSPVRRVERPDVPENRGVYVGPPPTATVRSLLVSVTPLVGEGVMRGAVEGVQAVVETATGWPGIGIVFTYSFLIAFALPGPSEIVLVAPLDIAESQTLTLGIIVFTSAIGKALGSLFAFHLGQEAKKAGPITRWIERSRFDVISWSEKRAVGIAQKYGYVGLGLALCVPFFPDTISIYAFAVLEESYPKFAVATFFGSLGRLVLTVTVFGGAISLL